MTKIQFNELERVGYLANINQADKIVDTGLKLLSVFYKDSGQITHANVNTVATKLNIKHAMYDYYMESVYYILNITDK